MKKFNLIITLVTLSALLGSIVAFLIQAEYHTAVFAFVAFCFCLMNFISERNNEKQHEVNSSILEFTEDTLDHYNELYYSIDKLYAELKKVSPDNKVADEIIKKLNVVEYGKDEA